MNKAISDSRLIDGAMPVISVIMPVYNGEKYLAEAIDSILSQTFSDFELIIIDDGSTDDSLAILKKYQAIDVRVRVFSRENKGVSNTLNECICLARGEWIAHMDQDDIALPQRFEKQLQHLAETGADICGSWIQLFGISSSEIVKYAQTDAAIKVELLFMSAFAHPTVVVKTSLIKQLYYDNAWNFIQDYDLWIRAAQVGWKMANVPEVLLRYRKHSAQITSNNIIKRQELCKKIQQRYWHSWKTAIEIKSEWIDEVLKTRDPVFSLPNMDYVDLAFSTLLQSTTNNEARTVIFNYLTEAYLRAAGSDASVFSKWNQLHQQFGKELALRRKTKLYLFTVLRLKPNSFLVVQLRKMQYYIKKYA